MIYAGILAGGKGVRMNRGTPKQFVSVCGKPVLYYPVSRFASNDGVGCVIVSCNREYMDMANRIAETLQPGKVRVIEGGHTRHQSFVNIVDYIRDRGFAEGDKIILHEAARPLVQNDLIAEHVRSLSQFEATNTLYGAVDTMMMSHDGQFIDQVPPKQIIYHGQGPQGYDLAKLMYVLEHEVTEDDLNRELDLCAIYLRNKRRVKIIRGNEKLFKITYPDDFALLEYYLLKG